MARRCFDHLHAELSVEIGTLVPRYALWIHVQEAGLDPEALPPSDAVAYLDRHLDAFLGEAGLQLAPRGRVRLRRRLRRFDPSTPTPYETMERLFGRSA